MYILTFKQYKIKREEFNLEDIEKKTIEQLRHERVYFGSDRAFIPLLKRFIDKALDAKMEAHLDDAEQAEGNKRNGKGLRR